MRGIQKSFGGAPVLNSVDFTLEEGEIHALVGGNGAGKSTLMKIMTGVYTRDGGDILVGGEPAGIHSVADAERCGVAMIFQELSLVPSMTVAENIFLNRERTRGPFRDVKTMNRLAAEALENLGITLAPQTPVSELSVGLSQMVEIAKALAKNARILIFDEPTSSLSDTEAAQLFAIMRSLKEKGISMVYISHRMNEILGIADRVTVLKDGCRVASEPVTSLTLEKIVSLMMGGEENVNHLQWIPRQYDRKAPDLLMVEHLRVNEKVADISFSLKHGEILGFAGLMGSGRTEILETIFGLRKKMGGRVLLRGEELRAKTPEDAIRAGLALIPEDRRKKGLILQHEVKDNVVLPIVERMKKGIFCDDKTMDNLVRDNIRTLDIKTDSIQKLVSLLSGGNQQKIVIAKWLNTKPQVMMFDEPTAGVDIGAKGEVIRIVREYADQGNGVLFVSSELSEMMAVCDRIIVLFDGHITGDLARGDIKTEEELQNAIQRE